MAPPRSLAFLKDFCVYRREQDTARARFATQKRTLRAAQKSLRAALRDRIPPDAAWRLPGPQQQFAVRATCFTTAPITLEMVHTALADAPRPVEAAALAKRLNQLRSVARHYPKIVAAAPRRKRVVAVDGSVAQAATKLLSVQEELAALRKDEQQALAPTKTALAALAAPVSRYAATVPSQQINLHGSDGVTHSFFLQRRVRRTKPKLTKQKLVAVLRGVLQGNEAVY
jgi:hypothetical protein